MEQYSKLTPLHYSIFRPYNGVEFPVLQSPCMQIELITISSEDVNKSLIAQDVKKGMGPDQIPPRVPKMLADMLSRVLAGLLNSTRLKGMGHSG